MAYIILTARCLLACVFAVSALSKLRGRSEYLAFVTWLEALPLPRWLRSPATAAGMTGIEIALVILLLLDSTARIGLLCAAAILAVFAGGTWISVRRGATAPCRCFGTSRSPMGTWHVVRDAVLSLFALTAGLAVPGSSIGWAGITLCAAIAVTATVPVVLFDDLLFLFRLPAVPADGRSPSH